MFDSLSDEKLRAAHDAAQLLYDNHRALGLDPGAIKLDTLRADIAVELENRGKATPAVGDPPAGAGNEFQPRPPVMQRSARRARSIARLEGPPPPGIAGWPASGLVRRPGGRSRAAPAGRCGYRP